MTVSRDEYIHKYYNCRYFTENTRIMCDGATTAAQIRPLWELGGNQLVFAVYNNGVPEGVQAVYCEGEVFEEFGFEGTILEIKSFLSVLRFTS